MLSSLIVEKNIKKGEKKENNGENIPFRISLQRWRKQLLLLWYYSRYADTLFIHSKFRHSFRNDYDFKPFFLLLLVFVFIFTKFSSKLWKERESDHWIKILVLSESKGCGLGLKRFWQVASARDVRCIYLHKVPLLGYKIHTCSFASRFPEVRQPDR